MADLVNEFTWSVSRHHLFEECRRAYYYHYYGSWGGWDRNAPPVTRNPYILKNLQSLEMWAGQIVHETIQEALTRYSRDGTSFTAAELQARARAKLRRGWTEAVKREWLASPKKTNLEELYYGNGRTVPRERTDAIRDRVYSCLAEFAKSEVLKEILAVSYLNWRSIEKLESFPLDGLKVYAVIDFSYMDPAGILRILDWKTGAERASLELQLSCYAFLANEKWHTPYERMRLAGVFLGQNARLREMTPTPEVLGPARDTIVTSAAAMREALRDPAANVAEEDDFPCTEDLRRCRRCRFREACPKGEGRSCPRDDSSRTT